jgi:4-hydroxy-tetrahydrodipicolinate reductase
MSIQPEIAGGIATEGIAVNMIPHVVAATPGLKRMIDLPVPAALMGDTAYQRNI